MKSKYMLPLILLVVILSLAAYLFVFERKETPTQQQDGHSSYPDWLLPDPSLLEYLALENSNGKIVFEKNQDGWWEQVEPKQANLDFDLLQLLIDELAKAKRERIVEENPDDLSIYQLDGSPAKITMGLSGHSGLTTYSFGAFTPSKDYIYTREEGRPEVFLIKRGVHMYIYRDSMAFHLKVLLIVPTENVSQFSIKILDPELQKELTLATNPVLAKQVLPTGEEAWNVLEPVQEKADIRAVKKLLGTLSHQVSAEALNIEDNLEDFGLDKPRAVIRVAAEDGGHENILFGKSGPEKKFIYAWNQGRKDVILFPYEAFLDLVDKDYRVHKLIKDYIYKDFSKISVEFPQSPKNNYSLVSASGAREWTVEGETSRTFPGYKLQWVVGSFREMEFIKYIYGDTPPASTARLDPPRAVLTFYSKKGELLFQFAVGTPDQYGYTYVLDKIRNQMVLYGGDVIFELPPDKKYFFSQEEPAGGGGKKEEK